MQVISVPLYVVPNSTEFPVIRCTHYYGCKDKLRRRFSATVLAQPEPITIATCLKELQCRGWQVHFVYNANYSSLIAMKIEKYLVYDKIAALCEKIYLPSIAPNVTDNKNELWKTVFKNHNCNPFQSSSRLSIPACFRIYCVIHTFF